MMSSRQEGDGKGLITPHISITKFGVSKKIIPSNRINPDTTVDSDGESTTAPIRGRRVTATTKG
jgi:hypothetical protein